MDETLRAARDRLEQVTPLKKDCGKVCGAACCRSLPGEETGMWLFPGEEENYRDRPGWQVRPGALGWLLICPGRCERDERPLSCRLFPLLPVLREAGVRVEMDQRARAVCPLAWQGKAGLDPAFVRAVAEAGELLAAKEEHAAFLRRLTEEQDAWRTLRDEWKGKDDD